MNNNKVELFLNNRFKVIRFGSIKTNETKCDYYYCGCRRNLNFYNCKNFVYYDIPKCASQKIRSSIGMLGAHTGWESTLYFMSKIVKEYNDFRVYSPLEKIIKKYLLRVIKKAEKPYWLKEDSSVFNFTFVRNPVDRIISAYKMFLNPDNENRSLLKYHLFGKDYFSIGEFLDYIQKNPYGNCHWIKSTDFIDINKNIMIYKVEEFESSWRHVCEKLNISFNSNKYNQSTNVELEVDSGIIRVIEEIYKEDFERFSY